MTKSIQIQNLTIGDGCPKICVPIMAATCEELKIEALKAMEEKADLVEWRVDFFENVGEVQVVVQVGKALKTLLNEIPLIFTFRTKGEGGEKEISFQDYKHLLIEVALAEAADIIDVEYYFNEAESAAFCKTLKACGACIILSNHHFAQTPSCDQMLSILEEMKNGNGDVVKLAVMPHNKIEVLELLTATTIFSQNNEMPVVTMSMGEFGMISRILGGFTGSAITFGAIGKVSAPGQLPIQQLRKILSDVALEKQNNIFLIGFMGTGKSTVSRKLKDKLQMKEIDLDAYIEEQEGDVISHIFKERGETYFRMLETNALKAVAQGRNYIISCGGGTVLKEENIAIMKQFGTVVLLTASPETILERVKYSNNRPILNGNMNVAFIEKMQNNRSLYYQKAADVTIATDGKNIQTICEELIKKLNNDQIVVG